jgi:hypothetical protein
MSPRRLEESVHRKNRIIHFHNLREINGPNHLNDTVLKYYYNSIV